MNYGAKIWNMEHQWIQFLKNGYLKKVYLFGLEVELIHQKNLSVGLLKGYIRKHRKHILFLMDVRYLMVHYIL